MIVVENEDEVTLISEESVKRIWRRMLQCTTMNAPTVIKFSTLIQAFTSPISTCINTQNIISQSTLYLKHRIFSSCI